MLIISPLVVAFIALFAAHEVNGQQQPDLPIAIINGKEISTETYHRFLTTAIGSDQLSRMVDSILVAQAAQQHQITASDDEIETRVQQNWLSILAGESEDDFLQRLKPLGFNKQMTLASLRQTAITQVLLEKYVVTTRIVTDEKLNREFASTYGFNGVKTEVAHILIMPHYIRAEAMRNNQELSYEQAYHQARELAQQCLASLNSGEDFAELVVKYSNDNASNLDRGILPTYRPGMYGDGFSQMVDSLDENAVPPNIVESGAGFHIVQVNSRVKTNFEDVKHDLSLKILQAPADITEIKNAIVDLREAATIEYPQNQSEE